MVSILEIVALVLEEEERVLISRVKNYLIRKK